MKNEKEIDACDVFNPADFVSLRLGISLQNLTTRTTVTNSRKISIIEIGDRSLTFEMPMGSCNIQHSVLFEISKIDAKTKKFTPLFKATGKVSDFEKLEDARVRVVVDMIQFDERGWNDFLSIFNNRQEEITQFLAAVKG